ncbi:MAG: coenzyme F420-0:L-glutamate ligase [Nitrosopumilaceae archaeon]|nr:coenzyme F420-0:L-glutamate ligase [Nitrosopumilaceae archaeon]
MALSVFPLASARKTGMFELYGALQNALDSAGMQVESGDVVVASTKFVAISQGRTVPMEGVRVSGEGARLSRRFRMGPKMAEMVLRESEDILGGMTGFVLAHSGGLMAPNAGIDTSNAGQGMAVLYPSRPYHAAESLRRRILLGTGANAGVILADSRLMPGRVGTVGVAVAYAGIEPVRDMRGKRDLDGRLLRVTFQAVADGLASAANHTMGEGSESRPFALVRGSGAVAAGEYDGTEAVVDPSQCVYARGLGQPR